MNNLILGTRHLEQIKVNYAAYDSVICHSSIEKLDPDLDPKSGSRKKRIFDKLMQGIYKRSTALATQIENLF